MNTELPTKWIDYLVRFKINFDYVEHTYVLAQQLFNTQYYANSLHICNEIYSYIENTLAIQKEIDSLFAKIKQVICSIHPDCADFEKKYIEILTEFGLQEYPALKNHITKVAKTNAVHMHTVLIKKKQIHDLRSLIYDNLADYNSAIAEYYNILDISPNDDIVKFRMAIVYYKMENFPLAQLCLDIINEEFRSKYDYKIIRALVHERFGNFEDACCLYQQCVEIAPNESMVLKLMTRYMEVASKLPLFAKIHECENNEK